MLKVQLQLDGLGLNRMRDWRVALADYIADYYADFAAGLNEPGDTINHEMNLLVRNITKILGHRQGSEGGAEPSARRVIRCSDLRPLG